MGGRKGQDENEHVKRKRKKEERYQRHSECVSKDGEKDARELRIALEAWEV